MLTPKPRNPSPWNAQKRRRIALMLAVTTLLPLIVGIPTARWTLGRVDSVMDQLEYGRAFSLGHAMAHMVASGLLAGQDWDEFPPPFPWIWA